MADRIDISAPIKALCDELGLEPAFVGEFVITPSRVVATVYLKDENGAKHTVPAAEYLPGLDDGDTDVSGPFHTVVATETREFEVTT